MADEAQPIIIKKKKAGHGGHHGGAWKVAYADFVTAMMALFIVLWLMNSNEETQKAIGGYFSDSMGKGKQTGSGLAGSGETLAVGKQDMGKLKEKLEGAMKSMPQFDTLKNNIEMTVTGEGLRLELLESEKGMFFDSGSPRPTEQGGELLDKLAEELGKLENTIIIEGHTDAKPFNKVGYTNWELSVDRANAARKVMQDHGVRVDQIKQVRGYADQHLRTPTDPNNPQNRRVTVIVQYKAPAEPPEEEKGGKHEGGKEAKKEGGEKAGSKAEGKAPEPAKGKEPEKGKAEAARPSPAGNAKHGD